MRSIVRTCLFLLGWRWCQPETNLWRDVLLFFTDESFLAALSLRGFVVLPSAFKILQKPLLDSSQGTHLARSWFSLYFFFKNSLRDFFFFFCCWFLASAGKCLFPLPSFMRLGVILSLSIWVNKPAFTVPCINVIIWAHAVPYQHTNPPPPFSAGTAAVAVVVLALSTPNTLDRFCE